MCHVSTLIYVLVKATLTYHDTYFMRWLCIYAFVLSVRMFVVSLPLSQCVCVFVWVCVCLCASFSLLQCNQDPSAITVSLHYFNPMVQSCQTQGKISYYNSFVFVKYFGLLFFCYLLHSNAKLHKHVELAISYCKNY